MHSYRLIGRGAFFGGLASIGSDSLAGVTDVVFIPWALIFMRPVFRGYRASMLTRIAAATTYLLGDNEPMTAGEVAIYPSFWGGLLRGDMALAITDGHVLVMRIDVASARPRSILLVARPSEVDIQFRWGLGWGYPTLYVYQGTRVWPITGAWRILRQDAVLTAWRSAVERAQAAAGKSV